MVPHLAGEPLPPGTQERALVLRFRRRGGWTSTWSAKNWATMPLGHGDCGGVGASATACCPTLLYVGIKPSDCAAGVKVPFCTKCGQSTMKRASARCTTRKIIGRSRCYFDFVHFTILKLRMGMLIFSVQNSCTILRTCVFFSMTKVQRVHIFYFI